MKISVYELANAIEVPASCLAARRAEAIVTFELRDFVSAAARFGIAVIRQAKQ